MSPMSSAASDSPNSILSDPTNSRTGNDENNESSGNINNQSNNSFNSTQGIQLPSQSSYILSSSSSLQPNIDQLKLQQIKKRKKHKNSKLGCSNCKKRRVKCTEDLPQCLNCVKHKVKCGYLDYSEEQLNELRQAKLTDQFDELTTNISTTNTSTKKGKSASISDGHELASSRKKTSSTSISSTSTNTMTSSARTSFSANPPSSIKQHSISSNVSDTNSTASTTYLRDDDEEEEEDDDEEEEFEDEDLGILDDSDNSGGNNFNLNDSTFHQLMDFQTNVVTQGFNNILNTSDGSDSEHHQQIIYPIYALSGNQQQQQQQQQSSEQDLNVHQQLQQDSSHIISSSAPQLHQFNHQSHTSFQSDSQTYHDNNSQIAESQPHHHHQSLDNTLESTINYDTFESIDLYDISQPASTQPQSGDDMDWNSNSGAEGGQFFAANTSGSTHNASNRTAPFNISSPRVFQPFTSGAPSGAGTPLSVFQHQPSQSQFPHQSLLQRQPQQQPQFHQQQQPSQQLFQHKQSHDQSSPQQQQSFQFQQHQQLHSQPGSIFSPGGQPSSEPQSYQQQQQATPGSRGSIFYHHNGKSTTSSLPGAILINNEDSLINNVFSYKKHDDIDYEKALVDLLKLLGPSIDNGTCPLPEIRNVYHVWLKSFISRSFRTELMFSCLVNLTTNFVISTIFNNYESYKEFSDNLKIGSQTKKIEIEKLIDKTKLRNFALVKSIKHYAKVIKDLRTYLNNNDDPDLCAQASYLLSLMSIYDPESTLNSTNCFRDGLFSILNYNFNLLMKRTGHVPIMIWVHLKFMKNIMRSIYLPGYDPSFIYEFRTILLQFGQILKPIIKLKHTSNNPSTLEFIDSKYNNLINIVDDSIEKYFPILLNNLTDIKIQQQVLYDMLYSWVRFYPSRLLVITESSDPLEKILYLFYKVWKKSLIALFPQTKYFFLRDFDSPLILDLFVINRDVDIFLYQLDNPINNCLDEEDYAPLTHELKSISSYLIRIITFLQVRFNLLYRSTVYEEIAKKEFPIDDVKVWRDSITNIEETRIKFNDFIGLHEVPIKSFLKHYIKLENYPRVINPNEKSFIRKDDGIAIDGISAQTPLTLPSMMNTPMPSSTINDDDISIEVEVDLSSLQESGFLNRDFNIMKVA
ncbi:hypothetical protein DFJ63DRAFT_311722 [Scheffersomyces coipomensis]|uniref:uncharacterized protein n=1 Tax=Scheffersomyces coipomensis TaxID=1788519 RepID=UPI00315DC081